MKGKEMKIVLALAVLALTGCSSTNISKLTEALGHDSASSRVAVTTIYGNVVYSRMGPGATGMVAPDGTMTITGVSSNFTWPPELKNTLVGQTVPGPSNSLFKRIQ